MELSAQQFKRANNAIREVVGIPLRPVSEGQKAIVGLDNSFAPFRLALSFLEHYQEPLIKRVLDDLKLDPLHAQVLLYSTLILRDTILIGTVDPSRAVAHIETSFQESWKASIPSVKDLMDSTLGDMIKTPIFDALSRSTSLLEEHQKNDFVYTLMNGIRAAVDSPTENHRIPETESGDVNELLDLIGGRISEPPSASDTWGGTDANAMLKRLAQGVVERRIYHSHSEDFQSPESLKSWISGCLKNTAAKVDVFAMSPVTPDFCYKEEYQPKFFMLSSEHVHFADSVEGIPDDCKDAPARTWAPKAFHPDFPYDTWISDQFPVSHSPEITVGYDGQQVTSIHSNYTLDLETAQRFKSELESFKPAWFFVHIEGTDTTLVIPSGSSLIEVTTDDDGSLVTLSVFNFAEYRTEELRQIEFQTEWGKWVDSDYLLTDRELEEGIKKAEDLVAEVLLQELVADLAKEEEGAE